MCTKGLVDIYIFLYECYASLRSSACRLFGNFHTIYFYDGIETTNITVNYHTNILLEPYQKGIYYIQSSNENYDDDYIFDGTIDDVTRYLSSYGNPIFLNVSYQNPISNNRKNVILFDGDQILNVNFHAIDRYKNYMVHDSNFTKVTDIQTILQILLHISCTHILIIQTFPFKKVTYDIKDVTIDMIYS